MLNGQILHHGVSEIQLGTAPQVWKDAQKQQLFGLEWSRFNMQFRDPAKIF